VFTFLSAIGSASFAIFIVALALRTLSEYKRSPDHARRAVMVGSIMMLLLALLTGLIWILVVTHFLVIKNPAALVIVLFDLALLVYGWTTSSEKWKSRRNNWKSLLIMLFLSLILVIACVLTFVSSI
jgi:hypothetical protein